MIYIPVHIILFELVLAIYIIGRIKKYARTVPAVEDLAFTGNPEEMFLVTEPNQTAFVQFLNKTYQSVSHHAYVDFIRKELNLYAAYRFKQILSVSFWLLFLSGLSAATMWYMETYFYNTFGNGGLLDSWTSLLFILCVVSSLGLYLSLRTKLLSAQDQYKRNALKLLTWLNDQFTETQEVEQEAVSTTLNEVAKSNLAMSQLLVQLAPKFDLLEQYIDDTGVRLKSVNEAANALNQLVARFANIEQLNEHFNLTAQNALNVNQMMQDQLGALKSQRSAMERFATESEQQVKKTTERFRELINAHIESLQEYAQREQEVRRDLFSGQTEFFNSVRKLNHLTEIKDALGAQNQVLESLKFKELQDSTPNEDQSTQGNSDEKIETEQSNQTFGKRFKDWMFDTKTL